MPDSLNAITVLLQVGLPVIINGFVNLFKRNGYVRSRYLPLIGMAFSLAMELLISIAFGRALTGQEIAIDVIGGVVFYVVASMNTASHQDARG